MLRFAELKLNGMTDVSAKTINLYFPCFNNDVTLTCLLLRNFTSKYWWSINSLIHEVHLFFLVIWHHQTPPTWLHLLWSQICLSNVQEREPVKKLKLFIFIQRLKVKYQTELSNTLKTYILRNKKNPQISWKFPRLSL